MQKVPILPTIPWQATPELDADKDRSFPTPTPAVAEIFRAPVVILQAVARSNNY